MLDPDADWRQFINPERHLAEKFGVNPATISKMKQMVSSQTIQITKNYFQTICQKQLLQTNLKMELNIKQ